MNEATACERAGIVRMLWEHGQRTEAALRLAAQHEVPADQVAAALGLSRSVLRAVARLYDVKMYS